MTTLEDYLLSIPERVLRSTAAIVGGTSVVLTETLLPEVVTDSTTYQMVIGDLQRFVINRIAQMEPPESLGLNAISDDYIYHKMAGGVLETIALLTYRFSPVWVFAIAADVAGGSRVYFDRLVTHLKEHEVIDRDSEPESIPALLEAIQISSRNSAMAIDRPPLSQSELAEIAAELGSDYSLMLSRGQQVLPRLADIQAQMDQIAEQENLSLEELSGIMTVQASKFARAGMNTVTAVGKTSEELFSQRILDSYIRTLDEISQHGLTSYMGDMLQPFLLSAIRHLNPDQRTWTERKLVELRGQNG